MKWKFQLNTVIIVIVALAFLGGITGHYLLNTGNTFKTDYDGGVLKDVIKIDGSVSHSMTITNLKDDIDNIQIDVSGLEDFLTIKGERNFNLQSYEEKQVEVKFSNLKEKPAGVYIGFLKLSDGNSEKIIPVILEIKSKEVLFESSDISIYPKEFYPGRKLTADIRVYDLSNIGTSPIVLNYFLKSFNGETVFSETENIVVKNDAVISKTFDLPENAQGGYIFGLVLKYKNSVGCATSYFEVADEKFSDKFLGSLNMYVLAFVSLVILILLGIILYSIYSRDKLLHELTSQYRHEAVRQERVITIREKATAKYAKTPAEKAIHKRIFEKIRKQRKELLDRLQRQRIIRYRALKRTHKKNEMIAQVNRWKKQGYDIAPLEGKDFSDSQIKSQISLWKKKGYDTSVLGK